MRLETVRRTRIVTSWRAAGSSADHGRVERLTFRFTDGCEGEAAGLGESAHFGTPVVQPASSG